MGVSDIWKRLYGNWITTSGPKYQCLWVRYMLTLARYKLVKEALRERTYFLHTAPHLSSWLPIMLPINKWWQTPYFWLGTKTYDFLAGAEGIESSYFLTKSKALAAFPMLKKDNVVGAIVYYGNWVLTSFWYDTYQLQMAPTTIQE